MGYFVKLMLTFGARTPMIHCIGCELTGCNMILAFNLYSSGVYILFIRVIIIIVKDLHPILSIISQIIAAVLV